MKTNMEDIDKLIKETLNEEEAKFYDKLDEQNLFGMLGGLFMGKFKWIIIVINIISIFAFVAFIYCAIQFFNTEVTNELIKWGVLGTLSVMLVSMLKLFVWMQMDKNAIIREVKRLELQVSSLSGRMSE
ncbi:DUF6768 family protein [Flavivirga algicola]|uniref:Uncharacterized protein n=1 Tax=Flavivirga algicola TaxID=2729136 RepID=A0ABX1RRA3_9FLAO|nr:DUF6768 family protein [Flavivirga algicola]NMH86085.1 hypothetical protein [Flavivirga algicola]